MLNAIKRLTKGEQSPTSPSAAPTEEVSDVRVMYYLRDLCPDMVEAWEEYFKDYRSYPEMIKISKGDIFEGAPAADALVSPANSFGFMNGGIDLTYSRHFGWQMMERLQDEIVKQKDGELLVGDALIIPCFASEEEEKKARAKARSASDWDAYNEGQPIKFLISAPTMRVPANVDDTVNAYLAFRAIILAVKRHNAVSSNQPIRNVLCPGLGTAIGRMCKPICAKQMLLAYETFDLGLHPENVRPNSLPEIHDGDLKMKAI